METVYPDDNEIKFRRAKSGAVENILNDKVECTICKNELMNEIVSKKMIMVHRIHLVLCCYNCFYKLCDGNEFSCILCESNIDLSNCEKCNFNVCERCIKIHELDKVSNGVITKCFGCQPRMLWKQRAQTSNVLKIFSSQLDLPNGLLVNDIERENTVRKYLIKEAKNGQNSKTNNIKDQLCLDFLLSSYKSTVIEKVTTFSPNNSDNISIDEHLNEFIQICEKVIEKTCSALTNVKRVFNINSQLNPSVSAMMKSLLKTFDEDENVPDYSKINENSINIEKKNKVNQSPNMSNTRSLRSEKKKNVDRDSSKSSISSSSVNVLPLDVKVVIKRLDDSILSEKMGNMSSNSSIAMEHPSDSILSEKMNNTSSKINIDIEKDGTNHPLNLFNDSISSSEEENTRKLRSRKVLKIEEKKQKIQSEKSTKNKRIAKSDDEKENDRLINLSKIEKQSKKKTIIDENCSDSNDNVDTNITTVTKTNGCISSEMSINEMIENVIQNIDESDSGTDDNSQVEKYSVKDVFSEVKDPIGIPQIISTNTTDSDNSSIDDVVNKCLTECKGRGIKYYLKKEQENKLDVHDSETSDAPNELENSDTSNLSDQCDITPKVTRLQRLSPLKLPSTSNESESDSQPEKKVNGTKRKLSLSNSTNDSDSSSKYFKKTPKKRNKIDNNKSSIFDTISTTSENSDSSSDEDSFHVPVKKCGRIRKKPIDESDEESKDSSDHSNKSDENSPRKKGRKNIRKLKKKTELSQLTINALEEEASRKLRIEKRQQLYNQIYDLPTPMESCKKLVLDFDPETKKEIVVVHPHLVKFLKPHQVEGIKFLWNSVFESLAQVKNHKGSGSILAHCMGLGKTLQIITLIHTLFQYPEMGIKTVLIITPHATIENWCSEFHKWLNDIPEEKNFFVLNLSEAKNYASKKTLIKEWQRKHGVLISSYQLYRTTVNFKSINKYPTILEGLVDPGPDVVICDEGHLLKNQASAISKTINRIKTLRRIVLTGTPLQNNLKEYHCMVDFIRPNLLGSIKDFSNRFISPITNGQYSDSTPLDVKLMKKRSHVLHRMLEGFVQRFDYSVLTPFLPPKHEYVIYLKLSDKQIELYRKYLDNYKQHGLFANYHILQMIWTHPKLLELNSERTEIRREKQKLKDMDANLVNDETTSSESSSNEEAENDLIAAQVTESTKVKGPEIDINWWKPFVSKKDLECVYPYSKFLMMFSILKECEEIGDKVLIFSQSLFTLDLIQEFLENSEDLVDDIGGPYGKSWIQGQDFFRIDGSVASKDREYCCSKFNDVTNSQMRLLLLSTKAFNLGINLVGANRVVIFDVTWNPSLNVQSIFRIFRFGQTKPCYVYRLVSEGSMEQKMYERQISKLSMAFRVIDEHQIDRHFNAKDQEILYEFEPNSQPKSTFNLPKDRLMAELILKHKDFVIDILEHDSLLQNNEAEELDENDRNAAWDDYQKEKETGFARTQQGINMNNIQQNIPHHLNLNSTSYQILPEDEVLFNTLRNLFPQATMLQLNQMMLQVKEHGFEQ